MLGIFYVPVHARWRSKRVPLPNHRNLRAPAAGPGVADEAPLAARVDRVEPCVENPSSTEQ
eukprot:4442099-Pyramimonas_sp.AAC.1